MDQKNIDSWATVLHEARLHGKPVPQLGPRIPQVFRREHAYSIQEGQFRLRAAAGEKQIGWKMGLTSEAKRRQMNLDSPLYGFLTDRMQVPAGGEFGMAGSIHPKIEPEVAFRIAKDLRGTPTREQALDACDAVCACLEILDSRYEQFKYFSMEDVISDNSSSSHFVLGPWTTDFRALKLDDLRMEMSADGKVAQSGNSRDISGDPVVSIVQLCELLAARDQVLKAGSVVLAGAATTAIELKPGMNVSLTVEGLPEVSVRITEKRNA